MLPTAGFMTLAAVFLCTSVSSTFAAFKGYRNCKKVSGLSIGTDQATASRRADKEMKRNMQPWTAKGYSPFLADDLPNSYTLDCWEKRVGALDTHVCRYTILMCKYRKP